MKPTVGRMVYYHALGSADGKFPVGENRAAVISGIIDAEQGIVSLVIFNPTGLYFNQKVEKGETAGHWDWMPFQKDQQARMAPGTLNESHPEPIPETPTLSINI